MKYWLEYLLIISSFWKPLSVRKSGQWLPMGKQQKQEFCNKTSFPRFLKFKEKGHKLTRFSILNTGTPNQCANQAEAKLICKILVLEIFLPHPYCIKPISESECGVRGPDVPWGPPWVPAWQGAGWRARWRWWQVSGWRELSVAWTGLLAASAAAPDAPAPASAHAWAAAVAGSVRSCWRSLREAWKRQDARNCCGKSRERWLSFYQWLHWSQPQGLQNHRAESKRKCRTKTGAWLTYWGYLAAALCCLNLTATNHF